MPSVGPTADDGHHRLRHAALVHIEGRACEERGHRPAQQDRPHHAVQHQEGAIRVLAQQIARLQLKFIADGLQHEAEEDNHPQPVGPAEAGAVEQRERGEKGAAEGDERREGELPLATRREHHHPPLLLRLTQAEQERIASLHKKQKYQDGSQQGNHKPPILLK